MKKILLALACCTILASCEQSEGSKYGILQKVSHKTMPCDFYEIQVAYEGGKVTASGDDAAYSNAQEFKVTKEGYDTLIKYQGKHMIVGYTDDGVAVCGTSKIATTIIIQ